MPKKQSTVNSIFIFYNSPHGIKFTLSNGKHIVINGSPVSELYAPSGNKLLQGKFGITEIKVEEWNEIQKLYSNMPIFKSKRIFSAESMQYGKAQAKEQAKQSNSSEQINVANTNTKPSEIQ